MEQTSVIGLVEGPKASILSTVDDLLARRMGGVEITWR